MSSGRMAHRSSCVPRTTSVNSLEALTLPVLLKKLSKRNSIRPPTTLSSRLFSIPASKLVFSRSLCLTPALGLPHSPLKVLACTCYLLSSKLLSDTALVFLCSRLLVGAPRVRLAFWTSSGTTLSLVGGVVAGSLVTTDYGTLFSMLPRLPL